MPKHLAIFLPSLAAGGAERSLIKLAGGIAALGYSVDLVLVNARGHFLNEVSDSVRVIDLKSKRVLTSLPGLLRYLRQYQPSVLLSALHTNIVALIACRIATGHTKVVVSERNTLTVESRNYSSDIRMRLMPYLVRYFYHLASCIVAVSNGVADDLAQVTHLPRDRIKVIFNPIITPEFQEKTQESIEYDWFIPGEPPVLLSAGRLSIQKGFDVLIKAFAKVREIIPSRLLILGEGPERGSLETLIHDLGLEESVRLPGFVQNPYPYMKTSNVFVLSSRWEGLPGVLIEALYCGVPIISTDCPSGAREILAAGKYGSLIPVDNVEAMAQAITAALSGKVPRPPVESWQPYKVETIVNQYIDVLFNEMI